MNFIDQFRKYVGYTECPESYLDWAAISLIAACLADRVYLEKPFGSRIIHVTPNLYVLMLGPTANWKSFSKDAAVGLLQQAQYQDKLNLLQGSITAAALYDAMNPGLPGSEYHRPWNPKVYIVNDELSVNFKDPENADMMLRALTELYTPGKPFADRTRSHGMIPIGDDYVANWIACTTEDWLLDRVDVDMLEGGLFGRVCVVEAGYSKERIFEDDKSPTSEVSTESMLEWVNGFLTREGPIVRSKSAREFEREWYYSREEPVKSDPLRGIWQREPSLINKLEIVLAAANRKHEILLEHAEQAVRILPNSSHAVARLSLQADRRLRSAAERAAKSLLALIEKHGTIAHWKLAKAAYDRRIMADQLRRIVETWVDSGLVERMDLGSTKLGGTVYKWSGGKE